MPIPTEELKGHYFRVTDLWRRLCEEHSKLFDLTLSEYSLLLSSDIDELEELTQQKQEIVDVIQKLESHRAELIVELNKSPDLTHKVDNISELITLMNTLTIEQEQKHFSNFNSLLVDIIEKIQVQNKKNQLFINKAIRSLRDIREGAIGEKSYNTYTSSGVSKARSLSAT